MATIELNQHNFEDTVTQEGTVLVDLWAPWCGPCKMFGPTFQKSSESHPDMVFAKINTEEQQGLAGALQIRSIPTLMVFRDGILLYREAGALPEDALEDLIRQVSELDMDKIKAEIATREAANA